MSSLRYLIDIYPISVAGNGFTPLPLIVPDGQGPEPFAQQCRFKKSRLLKFLLLQLQNHVPTLSGVNISRITISRIKGSIWCYCETVKSSCSCCYWTSLCQGSGIEWVNISIIPFT